MRFSFSLPSDNVALTSNCANTTTIQLSTTSHGRKNGVIFSYKHHAAKQFEH